MLTDLRDDLADRVLVLRDHEQVQIDRLSAALT